MELVDKQSISRFSSVHLNKNEQDLLTEGRYYFQYIAVKASV